MQSCAASDFLWFTQDFNTFIDDDDESDQVTMIGPPQVTPAAAAAEEDEAPIAVDNLMAMVGEWDPLMSDYILSEDDETNNTSMIANVTDLDDSSPAAGRNQTVTDLDDDVR